MAQNTYKLTVKITQKHKHHIDVLKKRFRYKSMDKLIEDLIDERVAQMFQT